MRIVWIIRVYYLTGKRSLLFDDSPLGRMNLEEFLVQCNETKFPQSYLDYHNKQEWTGVLCVVGVDEHGNATPGFLEKISASLEEIRQKIRRLGIKPAFLRRLGPYVTT